MKGVCFKVGKEDSVNFWKDPWIPNLPGFLPKPLVLSHETFDTVNSLKLENGDWDSEKLVSLFDQESVKTIKDMFWAKEDLCDRVIWTKTKSRVFTVKSA